MKRAFRQDNTRSQAGQPHSDRNAQKSDVEPASAPASNEQDRDVAPGTPDSDEVIRKRRQAAIDAPLPGEEPDGGESTLSGEPREAGKRKPGPRAGS